MTKIRLPRSLERYISIHDPLLLKEGTQIAFGQAIIRNLILFRSNFTLQPVTVDLSSESSRKQTAPKDDAQIAQLEARGRARLSSLYEQIKIARARKPQSHNIDSLDRELLRSVTTVPNGQRTSKRGGIIPARSPSPAEKTRPSLRIAAIGHRVQISKLQDTRLFSEELSMLTSVNNFSLSSLGERSTLDRVGRTYCSLSDAEIRQWFDDVTSKVRTALSDGANIVFLPELALPPDPRDQPGAAEFAFKELHNKCDGQFFVFSGTRHENLYNRGLIIKKELKDSLERSDDSAIQAPHWHYKISSARALGESILGSGVPHFPSYEFEIDFPDGSSETYLISIPICGDAFDPTVLLALLNEDPDSIAGEPLRIVLVPSYNPSSDFIALLRDVSFVKNCLVIYLDGLHGETRFFLYGFDLEAFFGLDNLTRTETHIEERKKFLAAEKVRLEMEFKSAQSSPDRGSRDVIEHYHKMTKDREALQQSSRSLERLASSLRHLKSEGGLESLLSCGACEICASSPDEIPEIHSCGMDILYYNLPIELVKSLALFRELYFRGESFLPEPLRTNARFESSIFHGRRKKRAL